MSQLSIEIDQDRAALEPGDELTGTACWQLDQAPRTVELRLFWFTRGKGTEDAGVVETVRFARPSPQESRPFRLRLPPVPYSFSGKLISLVWALELVPAPSKEVARQEFVMAPGGQEVRLDSLPASETRKRVFAWSTR
jgi:hypothetical protein